MAIPPTEIPNKAPHATRRLLPNRRAAGTFTIEHAGARFTVTAGYYPDDGKLGELFINAKHASSAIDAIVSDAAIAISFALQFGADLATIRAAMKRTAAGEPQSPIGRALDEVQP